MNATQLVTALLCLVLSGCEYGTLQEVAISPDLPAEVQEGTVLAAQEWCEAHGVCLPIRIGEDRGLGYVRANVGCENYPIAWAYTWLTVVDSADIRVCLEHAHVRTVDFWRQIMMHEIGHAVAGRSDHLEDGTLMAEAQENSALHPTPADVEYIKGE